MSGHDMGDFDLDQRLRRLRESARALEAPERVETTLRAALLAQRSAPPGRPAGVWRRWVLAAAATVVVTVGLFALLRPAPKPPAPAAGPAEIASGFIPLVPDPESRPGESFQVMRVSMPRSALQSFGLPVDENRAFEMVKADIVVGQDMVARAIRVVR